MSEVHNLTVTSSFWSVPRVSSGTTLFPSVHQSNTSLHGKIAMYDECIQLSRTPVTTHTFKGIYITFLYSWLAINSQPYKWLLCGFSKLTDLSWSHHIGLVCRKTRRLLGMLYRKVYQYSSSHILVKLYKSLIRPHMEYACSVHLSQSGPHTLRTSKHLKMYRSLL